MLNHKQVPIDWFDGETIEVDEGLAELLSLCYQNDIFTLLSCQENRPGIAWICFAPFEAEKFINLITKHPKVEKVWKTFYGRVFGYGSKRDWEYKTNIGDFGAIEELKDDVVDTKFTGKVDCWFDVSIRFPVSDIPLIVKRLKQKNPA